LLIAGDIVARRMWPRLVLSGVAIGAWSLAFWTMTWHQRRVVRYARRTSVHLRAGRGNGGDGGNGEKIRQEKRKNGDERTLPENGFSAPPLGYFVSLC
jgi:hypothetical protein